MNNSTQDIAEGRAAWERLRNRARTSWDDWSMVGRALVAGRTETLKKAKTNRPVGSTYNRMMSEWLRTQGFDSITTPERYRAILCVENSKAIEAWRATLDDAKRRKLNHPGAVWHAWRRSLKPATPAPQRQQIVDGIATLAETARQGRAVFWPQAAVRRAYESMLKSQSHDLLVLARVALQGAIRSEADLLALLPAEPPQTHSAKAPAASAVVDAA